MAWHHKPNFWSNHVYIKDQEGLCQYIEWGAAIAAYLSLSTKRGKRTCGVKYLRQTATPVLVQAEENNEEF